MRDFQDFAIGDIVEYITQKPSENLTIGKPYKVVHVVSHNSGFLTIVDDRGYCTTQSKLKFRRIQTEGSVTPTITGTMTKKQYRKFVEGLFDQMKSLIEAKNSDYSPGDDPFANFRISEDIGIDPLKGLFLRIQDKMQRFKAWASAGKLEVEGEGLEDVFMDLIGYSCLAMGMLRERKENAEAGTDGSSQGDVILGERVVKHGTEGDSR